MSEAFSPAPLEDRGPLRSTLEAKVLIVDDDAISRYVLTQAVEASGRKTICASSGEEAWDLIRADPELNMAFIDWLMPGMDGAELCRRIKGEITDRYIYAIMVTAKNKKEDIVQGLESGADDYISKPVHSGELVSRMNAGERVLNYEMSLRIEREKSDRLLGSILPDSIADRLKSGENPISDFYEDSSILFIDIVGFTEWCMRMNANDMISELAAFFSAFDEEIAAHGVEKIKSIGDAYMIASGLPMASGDHAHRLVGLALAIHRRVEQMNENRLQPWAIRSGIASGPLIAGVIGRQRFIYDAWGPTVNLAARLESMAPVNCLLVSERTRDLISDEFECREQGRMTPKGMHEQMVWAVEGPKAAG